MSRLVLMQELCDRLGISQSTYYRMKRENELPENFPKPISIFGQGKQRFKLEDIEQFIEQLSTEEV